MATSTINALRLFKVIKKHDMNFCHSTISNGRECPNRDTRLWKRAACVMILTHSSGHLHLSTIW